MLTVLTASAASTADRYSAYIARFKDVAIRHQQQFGIPASITLAQGLLESGAGAGTLAVKANNHFGIKCSGSWNGPSFSMDDDAPNECFRKYGSPDESYDDHARFLMRRRYADLFKLKPTDYRGWAHGLKRCGYATDPRYAEKLIDIIERYGLSAYDTGQPVVAQRVALQGDESIEHYVEREVAMEVARMHKIRKRCGLHYITAYNGDTFVSLAEEFGLKPKELAKYNDYPSADSYIAAGEIIYLEKKHKTPADDARLHIVNPGESAHSIAQLYGIQLKPLLKRNKLRPNALPLPGTELKLR